MNTRSLRFRMTTWYVGLLAAALLLFGATVYYRLERHLIGQLKESLVEQARTIAEELLVDAHVKGDQYVITEINESYDPEVNGRFIRVTRQDGHVLYHSGSPRDASFDVSQILPPTPEALEHGYPPGVIGGNRPILLQGLTYVTPNGERYLIETGSSNQPIAQELRTVRLTLALGIPVFILVAVFGGLILVRNLLDPIRAITEQAEHISSANINERLPVVHTGDEVERLSLSLNRMIERLDEAIQHISRFSADVSHELRTPLTILRGELEAMASQRSGDAESMDMVGNALEEIDRLSHIVDQLLVISRLDAGQAGIEHVPMDLGELAVSTAEQMHLMAEERRISIRFAASKGVHVNGDPLRMKQILVNLLDNAIKYSPEGSWVEVRVQAQQDTAVLTVSDNGIGIAPESLPHIFERFYRADRARTRTTGGIGLGLSIVKSIVGAHEGHISVQSREGEGTSVRMELPLRKQQVTQDSGKLDAADDRIVQDFSLANDRNIAS